MHGNDKRKMKKLLFIIATLTLFSCDENFRNNKPDKLIDQNTMENILYDIKIINAARSKNFTTMREKKVEGDNYIYEKYKIDSVTLRQNIDYYSTSFKKYKEIHENVKRRFAREKNNVSLERKEQDSLLKLKNKTEPKTEQKTLEKVNAEKLKKQKQKMPQLDKKEEN